MKEKKKVNKWKNVISHSFMCTVKMVRLKQITRDIVFYEQENDLLALNYFKIKCEAWLSHHD